MYALDDPRPSELLRRARRESVAAHGGDVGDVASAFVARYETVGHRDGYLWRWARANIEGTTLSFVPDGAREALTQTKLLYVILNVLLDDLADRRGDGALLEEAIAASVDGVAREVAASDRAYVALIAALRAAIDARSWTLPAFDRVAELLTFDWQQVCNCMRYARLMNAMPGALNASEHAAYTPHNMNMMVFAALDLAAAPDVDALGYGAIREIAWHMQAAGQLANMMATWPREIRDRDFTSAVFVAGLQRGVFTLDELRALPPDAIEARVRGAGLEADLLQRWCSHRRAAVTAAARTERVDAEALAEGLDVLLGSTLDARARL
jgi:hypothetical protein